MKSHLLKYAFPPSLIGDSSFFFFFEKVNCFLQRQRKTKHFKLVSWKTVWCAKNLRTKADAEPNKKPCLFLFVTEQENVRIFCK